MSDVALFLLSIARTVAGALLQPGLGGQNAASWAGYLNLAASIAERTLAGSSDMKLLDSQLKEAIAAGRGGLTPEQLGQWRAQADVAVSGLKDWLASHPEPGKPPAPK